MRIACALVLTVRFERDLAGLRKAVAVLTRRPLWAVRWDVRNAFLYGTIVVGVLRNAELARSGNKGIAQRMPERYVRHRQRAGAPPEGVVAFTYTGFAAAEIR